MTQGAPNGGGALVAPGFQITPKARQAMVREDVHGFLLHALGADADGQPIAKQIAAQDRAQYGRLQAMGEHILALRSDNIVALNDGEAFVKRAPNGGEIRRVTTSVTLSVAAGDLYQMTRNVEGAGGAWEKVPATPGVAMLTLAGLRKLNDVAGLQVGMTPTVCVGGVERSNPYVERGNDIDGCLGDVRRVVVCCVAAGLSAIGAPVVVRYVLEYEPANELRAALLARCRYITGGKYEKDTIIVPSDSVAARLATLQEKGEAWKAFPLYQGLVILVNLSSKYILEILEKHHTIISQAERRAQSFAARNAMKAHPALAMAKIAIDQSSGIGRVQVTGWTGEASVMADARKVLEQAVQAGGFEALMHTAEDAPVQVLEITGAYDPEDDAADTDTERAPEQDPESEEVEQAAADLRVRNELIDRIETALALLTPGEVEAVKTRGYDAGKNTLEQLAALDSELKAAAMKSQKRGAK